MSRSVTRCWHAVCMRTSAIPVTRTSCIPVTHIYLCHALLACCMYAYLSYTCHPVLGTPNKGPGSVTVVPPSYIYVLHSICVTVLYIFNVIYRYMVECHGLYTFNVIYRCMIYSRDWLGLWHVVCVCVCPRKTLFHTHTHTHTLVSGLAWSLTRCVCVCVSS